jgi:hypothetical protein
MDLNEIRIAQFSVPLERGTEFPEAISQLRLLIFAAALVAFDLMALLIILE